jgi:hypothetical protein
MQSAKIEQLRKDIAALEVVIAILEPVHEITVSLQDILFCKKKAAESLENAAYPAEVVRADQLKAGDKVLCGTAIETVGEIDDSDGNEFQRTVILKDFRRRFCSNHELIARIVEAKPCD